MIVAGTSAGPWEREAAAEAQLGAMTRAWLTVTISMPAATALREPRMIQAPPHREAEVIAAAVLALAAPPAAALAPVTPPLRFYPEAVILRALRHGDRAFGRCWSRARDEAAAATPRKARLHLEVDSAGVVRAARTAELDDGFDDSDEVGALPGCIARVGLRLPFPALGQPVKLSLLLLR